MGDAPDVTVVPPLSADGTPTDSDPPDDGFATPDGRAGVPGTYTLVVVLAGAARIEVGALGVVAFDGGAYAYTGSAFGPGGLSRVDRHRRVAVGEHDVRHWHVDYLTGHPDASLAAVVLAPHVDAECAVASALGDAVPGFGASDCACASHLAAFPDARTARSAVERVYAAER